MFNRIYLEITNTCNMSCSFCIKNSRVSKQMSIQEFSSIINKVKGYTKNVYLHVLGEPTSHPNLVEFLKILEENNMNANITTNGTLLNEKILLPSLRKISISLHSIEKGSLNDNQRYLEKVFDFISTATKTTICELRLWNIGSNDLYNKEIVQPLLSKYNINIDDLKTNIKIKDNLYIGIEKRFVWPQLSNELTNCDTYCHGLKKQLAILVDGTVVPCCLDSTGIINLGNIYTSSLEEILNTKKAINIVNGFNCRKPVEELCKRCNYATRF